MSLRFSSLTGPIPIAINGDHRKDRKTSIISTISNTEYTQLLSLFLFLIKEFIYLWLQWVFLLNAGFFQLWWVGATLHCHVKASHCSAFSCCASWMLGSLGSVVAAWAQELWLMSSRVLAWGDTVLVIQWHMRSSLTGDRPHALCIGRQILYHWATREASSFCFCLCHFCLFMLFMGLVSWCPSVHGVTNSRTGLSDGTAATTSHFISGSFS